MTFSLLLLIGIPRTPLALAGGTGIVVLMGFAFFMPLRVMNSPAQMIPCLSLLALSTVIAWIHWQRLNPYRSGPASLKVRPA